MNHCRTYGKKRRVWEISCCFEHISQISICSDDKFYIHICISPDMWYMLAHFGFVVVYLLGEGYVIPVCIRVIQIFTVTERVSG